MGHIEAMPSKTSTSKFVFSLIEYIMTLPDAGEYKQLVMDLVISAKLESGDRQLLLQNAVTRALDGNKSVRNWIANFSEVHPNEFKGVIEPLLGKLEAEQLTKLGELTHLELKVS